MTEAGEFLDRSIPDRVHTENLPPTLAAEVDHLAGRHEPWLVSRPDVHPGVRARALVAVGDGCGATEALCQCMAEPWTPQGLAAGTWAASRVGPVEMLADLATEIDRHPDGFLIDGDVPLTTTDCLRGLAAGARGDLESAVQALRTAVVEGDRRAPLWGALARVELARVLQSQSVLDEGVGGAPGEAGATGQEAHTTLTSAETFFLAGGYRHLATLTHGLGAPVPSVPIAQPMLGQLVRGEWWSVGFGVSPPVDVPDRRGLYALAHLIDNRDRKVPAVELAAVLEGASLDESQRLSLDILRSGVALEDAELTQALREVLLDDRVRSRVSKLLRRTITGLGGAHPLLAAHLAGAVRTGFACRYRADERIRWRR